MAELVADILSRTAVTIAGVVLFVMTTISLMRTVIVPRSLRSVISDTVAKAVTGTAFLLARMRRDYVKRDSILAWAGPLIILLQLITWLVLYLLAYGLILYGIGRADHQDLGDSLRQAGSSLFTLGFADIDNSNDTIIDFIAAATGPIVIALMIGFLPTIYTAYIEREAAVASLGVATGEPAWGPEMVSRFFISAHPDAIANEFAAWAEVASNVRLSHSTYPVLMWVRSPRPYRHFLLSLLASLDAALLMTCLSKQPDRPQAFHLLVQGGQTMEVLNVGMMQHVSLRRSLPLMGRSRNPLPEDDVDGRPLPDWDLHVLAIERAADADALHGMGMDAVEALKARTRQGTTLPRSEFDRGVELLRRSGFPIDRDLDEAWGLFRAARARYEGAAYSMLYILDAPPAPWSGPRRIPTEVVYPHSALALLDEFAKEEPADEQGPESP